MANIQVTVDELNKMQAIDVVQSEAVVNNIYSVATLAPAICYLIVGLILLFAYPLTRKIVEENSRILKKKHENKN